MDELIKSYPKYSMINDPMSIILLGGCIAVISGIWFGRLMQLKIINWENEKIPPTPLKSKETVMSWGIAFFGLSLFFTGMLEIFAFSPIKSLIASVSISSISGFTMWRVIKELMEQLEAGKVKEIDEYF